MTIMKTIEVAKRWINEGSIEEVHINDILKVLNSSEYSARIEKGFLCTWGRPEDFNVRRNEMLQRWGVFASKEEAEQKAVEVCGSGDRDGKFRFFRYRNDGGLVLIVETQDYKGDYASVSYSTDMEKMSDLLDKAAEKVISDSTAVELEKLFVFAGEIFSSKEEASKVDNFHPEECVCVLGYDAARLEATKQKYRMLTGTYGD